jgi:predicted metalloprotease with PDZ domain
MRMNQDKYRVHLSQNDRRVAHISAWITLLGPFLRMSCDGADLVPEGYAEFVRDLTMEDARGEKVQVVYTGRGEWKVNPDCPQPLTLRYTVVLTHGQDAQWPAGLDEAPHLTLHSVFWTGRALFLYTETLEAATVRFDIPPDWQQSWATDKIRKEFLE